MPSEKDHAEQQQVLKDQKSKHRPAAPEQTLPGNSRKKASVAVSPVQWHGTHCRTGSFRRASNVFRIRSSEALTRWNPPITARISCPGKRFCVQCRILTIPEWEQPRADNNFPPGTNKTSSSFKGSACNASVSRKNGTAGFLKSVCLGIGPLCKSFR